MFKKMLRNESMTLKMRRENEVHLLYTTEVKTSMTLVINFK
jgi:hypothetical protein